MFETGIVSSCFTFDLECSKLVIELYIRTLTDLANHMSELLNLIALTRLNCSPVHTPLYELPLSQSDRAILSVFQSQKMIRDILTNVGCNFQRPLKHLVCVFQLVHQYNKLTYVFISAVKTRI